MVECHLPIVASAHANCDGSGKLARPARSLPKEKRPTFQSGLPVESVMQIGKASSSVTHANSIGSYQHVGTIRHEKLKERGDGKTWPRQEL